MKDLILKIAKAQDGASFYRKFPTEADFMAKHGEEFYAALAASQGRKGKVAAQDGAEIEPIEMPQGPPEEPIDPTANDAITEYMNSDMPPEEAAAIMEMYNRDNSIPTSTFDPNSARDTWENKTGLAWKEAKRLGYTDGTAKDNIKLLSELHDPRFRPENIRQAPIKGKSSRTPIQHRDTPTGRLTPIKTPAPEASPIVKAKMTFAEALANKPKYQGTHGDIHEYDDGNMITRAGEMLGNPLQTFGEYAKYGELPSHGFSKGNKNGFDSVLGRINPFYVANAAANAVDYAVAGEYGKAGWEAVDAAANLPLLSKLKYTRTLPYLKGLPAGRTARQPIAKALGEGAKRITGPAARRLEGAAARQLKAGYPKYTNYDPNWSFGKAYQTGGLAADNPAVGDQMFNNQQKQKNEQVDEQGAPVNFQDIYNAAIKYLPAMTNHAPKSKLGQVIRGLTSSASLDTFGSLLGGKGKEGGAGGTAGAYGNASDMSSLSSQTSFNPSANYGGMSGMMAANGQMFGGSMDKAGNFINTMVDSWDMLQEEKAQRRYSEQMKQLTGVQVQAAASNSAVQPTERQYYRPQVTDGNQLKNVMGNDYNVMGQDGADFEFDEYEELPMYAGGGEIYGQLNNTMNAGLAPIYGNNAGVKAGGAIGGAAGGAIGGPLGEWIGTQFGQAAGYFLDGNQRTTKKNWDATADNATRIAGMGVARNVQQQYNNVAQDGDELEMYQEDPGLEDSIQTGQGGYVEKVAENPMLSGGGDIMRTYGNAHTNTGDPATDGIETQIGGNRISTEGGEIIAGTEKGEGEGVHVSGNLYVNPEVASMLGISDPLALAFFAQNKNKKAKNISIDIAKQTKKVNNQESNFYKKMGKSDGAYGTLEEKTFEAMRTGFDMKYKDLAKKTQLIADYNQKVNEFTKQAGIRADDFAKKLQFTPDDGSFRPSNQAENGMSLPMYQNSAPKPSGKKVSKTDIPKYEKEGYVRIGNTNRWVKKGKAGSVGEGHYKESAAAAASAPTTQVIKGKKYVPNENAWWRSLTPEQKAAHNKKVRAKIAKDPAYQDKVVTTPAPGGLVAAGLREYVPGDITGATPDEEIYIEDGTPADTKSKRPLVWPQYRPSSAMPFDYGQVSGEMNVLGRAPREVFAQGYKPLLKTPTKFSFQDQINSINSRVRGAQRFAGYNPAAQAFIMGQAQDPLASVYGEQFRTNQNHAQGIYDGNYDTLNKAALTNLDIYDRQAVRADQAYANTERDHDIALDSMNNKIAQHKLEDQLIEVGANMYPHYSYGPDGRVYKNPGVATWNMGGNETAQLSKAERAEQAKLYLKEYEAEQKAAAKAGGATEPTEIGQNGYNRPTLKKLPLTRLSKLY